MNTDLWRPPRGTTRGALLAACHHREGGAATLTNHGPWSSTESRTAAGTRTAPGAGERAAACSTVAPATPQGAPTASSAARGAGREWEDVKTSGQHSSSSRRGAQHRPTPEGALGLAQVIVMDGWTVAGRARSQGCCPVT